MDIGPIAMNKFLIFAEAHAHLPEEQRGGRLPQLRCEAIYGTDTRHFNGTGTAVLGTSTYYWPFGSEPDHGCRREREARRADLDLAERNGGGSVRSVRKHRGCSRRIETLPHELGTCRVSSARRNCVTGRPQPERPAVRTSLRRPPLDVRRTVNCQVCYQ